MGNGSTLQEINLSSTKSDIETLHVDDDRALVEMVATFLERESSQITVTTETSAESGLQILEEKEIDCIISDYDMPGLNGLEFLERVRSDHPDLPFILFTGKGDEEIASDAISAGVTDYLQKKGGTDQYTVLANRVENVVGKYRAEKEVIHGFQALETAQEGIGIIDKHGKYVYLNQAYADIYSAAPEELTGHHWEELYPEDEAQKFHEQILPELRDIGSWKGESVGVTQDGELVPEELTLTQMDTGGHVCVVRDISEKKKRERDLNHKKLFLDSALNSLDDLFYAFDSDMNYVHWNQALEEETGYTEEEMEKISPLDLFEGETKSEIEQLLSRIVDEGEQVEVEADLLTKSGETTRYEFTGSPVTNKTGQVVGVIGIGRRQPD
ncbi:PAS domain S-box protein [Natronolimnobius sp. AArcel1]|uniref:PAS domain-containing response regulator n=1 Tax=Natronolimnobius sp. AArcel1 TaxID=1679093 RepID=UPI0013ED0819|nr:PAS domain S-box protein [Natronolimnobius sp. AArcel1]NGM70764.1 PAS domain S-box protein [Natronolimnobius sp. AArcel1]